MVLLDHLDQNIKATMSFRAEISTYDGQSITVKNTQQPIVHFSHGSQICLIMLDTPELASRKRAGSAMPPPFGCIMADEVEKTEFKKSLVMGNHLSVLKPVKESSETFKEEVTDVVFEPNFSSEID